MAPKKFVEQYEKNCMGKSSLWRKKNNTEILKKLDIDCDNDLFFEKKMFAIINDFRSKKYLDHLSNQSIIIDSNQPLINQINRYIEEKKNPNLSEDQYNDLVELLSRYQYNILEDDGLKSMLYDNLSDISSELLTIKIDEIIE